MTIIPAAIFTAGLAGHKRSVWAYVMPHPVQNMMIGRAFQVENDAHKPY